MVAIDVNGQSVEAKEGDTILAALARFGVKVPTLCYMEGLAPTGACRICVVEVQGMPGLVPSCSYPVRDGMKIQTHSPRVLTARRTVVELLLNNHPDDCLYCSRNGTCELQALAEELGVRRRVQKPKRDPAPKDLSSPSIIRDPDKCILCGKCVRVCSEIQTVSAIDFINRGSNSFIGTVFNRGLNLSTCVSCGQCVMVCPTGALTENSCVAAVAKALADPDVYPVVQHAPSISVSLAEEFGTRAGKDVDGQMVAALRRVGFKKVFDTSFSADLTIMEEGSELVHRIQTGGVLPMLTSCSPGWVTFVEEFYPEFLPNISSCKSPQQMLGALIKSFFAEREGLAPEKIVSVSVMPCTAKKSECTREEMGRDYVQDVDFVLTTRELGQLLRMYGIDLGAMVPESADTPFGDRSTAGKIFGTSGGVMEAAVRTAYHLLTGEEMGHLEVEAVRGMAGAKELHMEVSGIPIGAAVVSGLGNARALLEEIKAGRDDLHFIEVMTCPGGCIAGGGQPRGKVDAVKARMRALYAIDNKEEIRVSHKNPSIERIYREFLGEPLGETSHHLLHTHYHKRDVMV